MCAGLKTGWRNSTLRHSFQTCPCKGLRAQACLPVLGPPAAVGAAGCFRKSERRICITDGLQYLRQGIFAQRTPSLLQGRLCMLRHLQWQRRRPCRVSALRPVCCSRAGCAAGVRTHIVRRRVSRRLCVAREPLPSRQPLPQLSAYIFLTATVWADAARARAGTRLPARHWKLMLRHVALEPESGSSPAVVEAKDKVLLLEKGRP